MSLTNAPNPCLPPQGLAGLSVQWGAWVEGGMAAGNAATAKAVERLGMAMIAPDQGVGAIQALLLRSTVSAPPPVTAAVPFRWGRFIGRLGPGPLPHMFEAFAGEAAAEAVQEAAASEAAPAAYSSEAESEDGAGARRQRASAAAVSRRRRQGAARTKAVAAGAAAAAPGSTARKELWVTHVQEAVASVLGAPVGLEDPLMASGLDSLGSGEAPTTA